MFHFYAVDIVDEINSHQYCNKNKTIPNKVEKSSNSGNGGDGGDGVDSCKNWKEKFEIAFHII